MEPAIKKVVIVLIAALVIVIGLIVMVTKEESKTVATASNKAEVSQQTEGNVSAEEVSKTTAEDTPNEQAKASDANVTDEAQGEQHIADEAQSDEMYEGAIAGLSEEEIAKMALAEEGSAARTEETGIENAVD